MASWLVQISMGVTGANTQGSQRRLLGKRIVVTDLEWPPCVAILWPQISTSQLPLSRLSSGHSSSPFCWHPWNENPSQNEKASLLVRRHWLGLFHFNPTRVFSFLFLAGVRVWLLPSSSLCEMSTFHPRLMQTSKCLKRSLVQLSENPFAEIQLHGWSSCRRITLVIYEISWLTKCWF